MKPQYLFPFRVLEFALTVMVCGCLKQDFDAPPDMSHYDPKLPVNLSIAALHQKMAGAGAGQLIDSDWTIYGIVTADDRTGNFYKQITIGDSTGGITIGIDGYSLYTRYPVGRKVYVKLKNLYYGFDARLPKLGRQPGPDGSLSSITINGADSFIVRANINNPVPVTVFDDLAVLKANQALMLNRLVRIEGVQFSEGDTSGSYAVAPAVASGTSINLEDCYGNKIILRTSGYATFRQARVPSMNGAVTAVYTVYNNTAQLIIRDTIDVHMANPRCGAAQDKPIISLDSLRKMFKGTTIVLGSMRITGVVISDNVNRNVSTGSYILQDGDRGIALYLNNNTTYKLGDSLIVDLSGASLKLYNGTLEVDNLQASDFERVAQGRQARVRNVTVDQILSDYEQYESTLVRLRGTFSGGPTMNGNNGNLTFTDATGSLVHYTAANAIFKNEVVPAGERWVTGYIGKYNSIIQLRIRNMQDIE